MEVEIPSREDSLFVKNEVGSVREKWLDTLKDLNVCSQKGLVEMFDGSIGAGSVFMPHGGKYQMTETQTMVAKVPVQNGTTDSVSMMSFGLIRICPVGVRIMVRFMRLWNLLQRS